VFEENLEEHCQIVTTRDLLDAVKELDVTDNKTVKVVSLSTLYAMNAALT
jgi:hypothetical protein